jgi:AraC-like DNA-binding protein
MSPTVAAESLQRLLEAAAELGLDAAELAAAASLDPNLAGQAGARAPLGALCNLWEAVAARWPRGDLVPRMVRWRSAGDYGVVGFLAATAPTVAHALDVVQTHLRVWADEPRLLREAGRVSVRWSRPLTERPGLLRLSEATLAEVLGALRAATHAPLKPSAVAFAHAAPADPRPLEAFFGAPVRWEAAETWLHLTGEQLAMPLPGADARLHALLAPLARAELERCPAEASVAERARQELNGRLSDGAPTAAVVARRLAMSERTLRRRLAQEGLGFRRLLEQKRVALARAYVANPAVPLSEVSFVLGFSEPSAFHRAFKRWTGQTPATFRRSRWPDAAASATGATPLPPAPR